jgi:hypothetical protein
VLPQRDKHEARDWRDATVFFPHVSLVSQLSPVSRKSRLGGCRRSAHECCGLRLVIPADAGIQVVGKCSAISPAVLNWSSRLTQGADVAKQA